MFHLILGIGLFALAFVFITFEWINKTTVVLTGAVIYIFSGIINQENAFSVIDWNVIFLLIGMMIIVGITRETGLFQFAAIKSAKFAKGDPVKILLLLSLITAGFSAVLDNVTTILIITPVSILIAVELGISPIPFVVSNAIASNIGGTATLIGDPPNILIGSAADLSFLDFIINAAPAAAIVLTIYILIIYLIFHKKMPVSRERKARIMDFDELKTITNKPLMIKSLVVIGLTIIGFMFHGNIGA